MPTSMKLNLERYAELEAKKSELEAIRLLLTGDRWTPGPCVQGRHPGTLGQRLCAPASVQ
jgi:hypothetical protein